MHVVRLSNARICLMFFCFVSARDQEQCDCCAFSLTEKWTTLHSRFLFHFHAMHCTILGTGTYTSSSYRKPFQQNEHYPIPIYISIRVRNRVWGERNAAAKACTFVFHTSLSVALRQRELYMRVVSTIKRTKLHLNTNRNNVLRTALHPAHVDADGAYSTSWL